MTGDSFSIFNTQLCKWLDGIYATGDDGKRKQPVVLIADGAGCHQQYICQNCGIVLAKLPPASPELNPVERFFEELRKQLADHIFENAEEVEEYLIAILKKYYDTPDLLISLTHYPYIRLPI
jgi:transposase